MTQNNHKPPRRAPPPPPPMRKGDGGFVPLYPMTPQPIRISANSFTVVEEEEVKQPNYFQRLLSITKYFLLACASVTALVLYGLGWQYGANNYGMLGVIVMTVVTLLLLAIPKWSKEE